MKVDAHLPFGLSDAAEAARDREAAGYSGIWTAETNHDPFLPLVLAAEHTDEIELGTSIAVAFARNPMLLANIGWDLQSYSGGRFILGLGSQIKPHITKRFSMEWSHPAPRMRELILAVRAIWDTWQTGTPLDVPRRVLPAHPDDPVLHAERDRPRRLRCSEDLPRRRGRADDRGRGRGLRRVHLSRVHHREVPPRGDAAGARARTGQGGQDDGGLRDRRSVVRRHRQRRGRDRQGSRGHATADRLLRIDSGLPGRARDRTAGEASRTSSTRSRSRASGSRWAA